MQLVRKALQNRDALVRQFLQRDVETSIKYYYPILCRAILDWSSMANTRICDCAVHKK